MSGKGFFGMASLSSLFGSVAVQKNVRDLEAFEAASGLSKPEQQG